MDETRCTLAAAALAAALPVDLIVDPTEADDAITVALSDAVRPERLHRNGNFVVGWGESAWRTRVAVGDGTATVPAPRPAPPALPTDWYEAARVAMAELLPNAVDAAVRTELVHRILDAPVLALRRHDHALRSLVTAHRLLRWSARRLVLQSVGLAASGHPLLPHRLPSWRLLARQARLPQRRLEGTVSTSVLRADAGPWCPTARQLLSRDSSQGTLPRPS